MAGLRFESHRTLALLKTWDGWHAFVPSPTVSSWIFLDLISQKWQLCDVSLYAGSLVLFSAIHTTHFLCRGFCAGFENPAFKSETDSGSFCFNSSLLVWVWVSFSFLELGDYLLLLFNLLNYTCLHATQYKSLILLTIPAIT